MLSRFIRGTIAGLTPLLISVAEELAREGRGEGDTQPHAPEEFRWSGRVEAGHSIVVSGLNGEVRAETAPGEQVEIIAIKHGRRDNPRAIKVRVDQRNGDLHIASVYPHQAARCEGGLAGAAPSGVSWWQEPRRSDVNVDFIVRVPQGVRFISRTVNGGISIALSDNDVETSTVNGNIHLSTGGHAYAKTINGSINARLEAAIWHKPVEFRTKNGGINVVLHTELNADFQVTTRNGKITHDLPLRLKGTPTPRYLAGSIGHGGSALILKATNGNIQLRQLKKSETE